MTPTAPTSLRTKLWRGFFRFIAGAAGLVLLVFLADYGILRVRIITGRSPYGSVVVHSYYAVQQKNGKTEFLFDPPASWICVHSLFPHQGHPPCWYLARHPDRRTDL